MGEIDEMVKMLDESIEEVQPLHAEGADYIRQFQEVVKNLDAEGNKEKAKELFHIIFDPMVEYDSYVPTSVAHFKKIQEILTKMGIDL